MSVSVEQMLKDMNISTLIVEPEELYKDSKYTVYKVLTSAGSYVIKVFNDSSVCSEIDRNSIIYGEMVGEQLQGVFNTITAIKVNGQYLHCCDGTYCLVYKYKDFVEVNPEDINVQHCWSIGKILGLMHNADVKVENADILSVGYPKFDLSYIRDLILSNGAYSESWGEKFLDAYDDLEKWNERSHNAGSVLSLNTVLSQGNLRPSKVIWHMMVPYVIDWESTRYVNPYVEFINTALLWCCDAQGHLNFDKVNVYATAYKKYSEFEPREVDWSTVYDGSYSYHIAYIVRNVERALNESLSVHQRDLAKHNVHKTVKDLYNMNAKHKMMRFLL